MIHSLNVYSAGAGLDWSQESGIQSKSPAGVARTRLLELCNCCLVILLLPLGIHQQKARIRKRQNYNPSTPIWDMVIPSDGLTVRANLDFFPRDFRLTLYNVPWNLNDREVLVWNLQTWIDFRRSVNPLKMFVKVLTEFIVLFFLYEISCWWEVSWHSDQKQRFIGCLSLKS